MARLRVSIVFESGARIGPGGRVRHKRARRQLVLDITIRGGKVYPITELLVARGIPFTFASGNGDWTPPKRSATGLD